MKDSESTKFVSTFSCVSQIQNVIIYTSNFRFIDQTLMLNISEFLSVKMGSVEEQKTKYMWRDIFYKTVQEYPFNNVNDWISRLGEIAVECDFSSDCCGKCSDSRILDIILIGEDSFNIVFYPFLTIHVISTVSGMHNATIRSELLSRVLNREIQNLQGALNFLNVHEDSTPLNLNIGKTELSPNPSHEVYIKI